MENFLGVVKIWEMKTGKQIYVQDNSLVLPAKEKGGLSIMHLLYNSIHNIFAVVSVDHNIIIHSLKLFECKKQVGIKLLNIKFYKNYIFILILNYVSW